METGVCWDSSGSGCRQIVPAPRVRFESCVFVPQNKQWQMQQTIQMTAKNHQPLYQMYLHQLYVPLLYRHREDVYKVTSSQVFIGYDTFCIPAPMPTGIIVVSSLPLLSRDNLTPHHQHSGRLNTCHFLPVHSTRAIYLLPAI